MSLSANRKLSGSDSRPVPPKSLPGFENVRRYWDRKHEVFSARILPGEYYVSNQNEVITTVLGSCISACIRDKNIGAGGMNHFMLPDDNSGGKGGGCTNLATRYGTFAMEHMINDILALGGRQQDLEIKLFGGGKMLSSMADIGERNIQFVTHYLATELLPITSEDLGGRHPRKVVYFPGSGKVLMKKMPIVQDSVIAQTEMQYQKSLVETPLTGDIDLF
ncbi:MAG: chemoreceptor glutamine deamidase CheD [Halioglobus sp.]